MTTTVATNQQYIRQDEAMFLFYQATNNLSTFFYKLSLRGAATTLKPRFHHKIFSQAEEKSLHDVPRLKMFDRFCSRRVEKS
jgi:hypothetical protein